MTTPLYANFELGLFSKLEISTPAFNHKKRLTWKIVLKHYLLGSLKHHFSSLSYKETDFQTFWLLLDVVRSCMLCVSEVVFFAHSQILIYAETIERGCFFSTGPQVSISGWFIIRENSWGSPCEKAPILHHILPINHLFSVQAMNYSWPNSV